jgi:dethiobiotin synthetase
MNIRYPQILFVTGTDTAVGKTVVSAIMVAGLQAEYWKPIQTGVEVGTDTDWVREKTGFKDSFFHPEAYRLSSFLSPHAAAARENIHIDLSRITIPQPRVAAHLIIEGAGGILVPINDNQTMADLIVKFKAPVLLVVRSSLGTINHTLLSIETLRRIGVDIFGVVMNGPKNPENRAAIESFGNIRVIAEIEPIPDITAQSLLAAFQSGFSGEARN